MGSDRLGVEPQPEIAIGPTEMFAAFKLALGERGEIARTLLQLRIIGCVVQKNLPQPCQSAWLIEKFHAMNGLPPMLLAARVGQS